MNVDSMYLGLKSDFSFSYGPWCLTLYYLAQPSEEKLKMKKQAEVEVSWKSNTSFSANYLKNEENIAAHATTIHAVTSVCLYFAF